MSALISGCASSSAPSAKFPDGTTSFAPPRLRLVALGGPMNDPERVERGVQALESIGFQLENLTCTSRRDSRFAGSIAQRVADLNVLADPAESMPDLILATRGGYGAVHLLDQLDYARLCPRLKQHGTILMGYSDNTAIQLALLAKGGVTTISGPMLYGDFAAYSLSRFTQAWFRRILTENGFTLRVEGTRPAAVNCSGTLWGGNLTVLTSLAGSDYLPQISGGILFLEDVGEDLYSVDRMLQQLRLAGVLGKQSAILFGHFSNQRPDGYDPRGYTLARIAQTLSRQIGVPILTGLPVGHVRDIVSLPIGADAQLQSDSSGFSLKVSGYPTLSRLPAVWQGAPVNEFSSC